MNTKKELLDHIEFLKATLRNKNDRITALKTITILLLMGQFAIAFVFAISLNWS